MYQNPRWKTMRIEQLGKQPLCQACLCRGIVNTASHVDHLFAWSQLGDDGFYYNILQSLCPECHSNKTALEQQGIYRHYTSDGIKDYSIVDYKSIVALRPD
jgi:5-methylcytosine-specific restriction endonuclease McrA